ncbi:MAG: hypothetical protein JW959_03730 [Pirellulales bacterium]|nr:hypothetical protein [Pirellulales bacterium]
MSSRNSTNPLEASAPIRPAVSHRKPRTDLYTVLLVISLLAILIGILFLYLQLNRFDFKTEAPRVAAARQAEKTEAFLSARGEHFSILNNKGISATPYLTYLT